MRIFIYILLAYFSVLNCMSVSNLHVHHDSVMHTVILADSCDSGNAGTRESDERENFSEHLYEHGCIVFSGCPTVKPVPVQFSFELDLASVDLYGMFRQPVRVRADIHEIVSSPCPPAFRLRAPPSFV